MTDRHDELLELCAGHVLGCLDDADRARLEAHLAGGCAECERELAELSGGAVALAATAPAVTPDAGLKERVLAAVAEAPGPRTGDPGAEGVRVGRREPKVVRLPIFAWVGWATAAVFAFGTFVQYRAVRDLDAQLDDVRTEQARLEEQLLEERQWGASMASPAARVAFLQPTPDGTGDLAGWALYDVTSRRAIIVLENLTLEEGHDFELWAIRGGEPRSLGVIEVDASGRSLVRLPRVEDPSDVSHFAISYEAEGGSPDPTTPAGPVVMLGELSI